MPISQVEQDAAAVAESFAQHLFARMRPEERARLGELRRQELAARAYAFFARRTRTIEAQVTPAAQAIGSALVVETLMPDAPFIVDSLLEYFERIGATVTLLLHPIFTVVRAGDGCLVSFEPARMAEGAESLVYAELEPGDKAAAPDALAAEIRATLEEVRRVALDGAAIAGRAAALGNEAALTAELAEEGEFLKWLAAGNFVFLGYRRYEVAERGGVQVLQIAPGSGLGILRGEERSRYASGVPLAMMDAGRRRLLFEGSALIGGKTRAESRVYRRRAMDDISLRRQPAAGAAVVFERFVGHLSSRAETEDAARLPFLRRKVEALLKAEGVLPGSHDYNALVAALNGLPKEELLRASDQELRLQLRLILEAAEPAAIRVRLYPDAERGNVMALVVMPRENFSSAVRRQIQQLLERKLGARLLYYHLALSEAASALLHFCLAGSMPAEPELAALQREIEEIARTWEQRLAERLAARRGEAEAHVLLQRWQTACDAAYTAATGVEQALADIERIEAMLTGEKQFEAALAAAGADNREPAEIRLYQLGEPQGLSQVMPVLHDLGLVVLSEEVHRLAPRGPAGPVVAWVQVFRVAGPGHRGLGEFAGVSMVAEALGAVRRGVAESDALHGLILTAGLSWRAAALLRTCLNAAFQMKVVPSRLVLERLLLLHPELARLLVELFTARLDPQSSAGAAEIAQLRQAYLEGLNAVDNMAEDRAARALLSLVEATVRTDYFCPPADDPGRITIKCESGRIAGLPDTAPLYEIHVNTPTMSGCHLRDGPIARGGIRFSDRPDDYRTEVLGLMKTQTVKNTIIVPVGAKGGFVVKVRDGARAEPGAIEAAYRTLVEAMLAVTDNLRDGRIERPAGVKVLDQDGAYLVVAADKGTAAFSDIANEISQARGFWLGDAFASGGRHGFDHKGMGITARGAWESALWHLRRMGRDPRRGAPITMVGVGDMSGDVFGNGLLQSRNVKLIAAFDHRHIFVDPDPDPEASFVERKRLFDQPGSQWSDYDRSRLSPGGLVAARQQKRIALSPQAQAALGCRAESLDGESLIRAILCAEVDLLYNGGIGTYVKAASETHAEVADHANDACRVDAGQLRARIVVEGGNLGLTQRARVEYALAGGRINTDAIDNSAGVDTSDREVNLKILLAPALARGAVTLEERNRLIAECAAETAEAVLRDNRDQVVMLSLEEVRSAGALEVFVDHLRELGRRALLRHYEEPLPPADRLRERARRRPGLTRPELALVAAYTKIDLTAQLAGTPLVRDPYLVDRFLRPYFAQPVAGRFAEDIPRHPLRGELTVTLMVNQLVDLMGSTFIFRLGRDYGANAENAVRAWLVADGLLELHRRVEAVEGAGLEIDAKAEIEILLTLERAAGGLCAWTLENLRPARSLAATIAALRAPLRELAARFETMLVGSEWRRFEQSYRELRAAVHEEQLAHGLARLVMSDHLLTIIEIARSLAVDPAAVARAYFGLAEAIEFQSIEDALDAIDPADRWSRRAAAELRSELRSARAALCRAALAASDCGAALAGGVRAGRERAFEELAGLFADLTPRGGMNLAQVQVLVRAIDRLAGRA